MSVPAPARRYDSVQQDWRAILPYAKGSLFAEHTNQLENAYLMFSVSLNEAIALEQRGDSGGARQQIRVARSLCARLALGTNAVLHAMRQHARHFGTVPNLALLEAANFHSECGQRGARYSNLVSHILLSERSQFLNKLNTMEEIVGELGDEFIQSAGKLAAGGSLETSRLWNFLDSSHFDLNTCLRETNILLKSFLLVLPEDQLTTFSSAVCALAKAGRASTGFSFNLIRARRMAAVAGE